MHFFADGCQNSTPGKWFSCENIRPATIPTLYANITGMLKNTFTVLFISSIVTNLKKLKPRI